MAACGMNEGEDGWRVRMSVYLFIVGVYDTFLRASTTGMKDAMQNRSDRKKNTSFTYPA